MSKMVFTESQIKKIVERATRRLLKEVSGEARFAELFEKNKEWHRLYPTKPGNENPYPTQIWHAYVKYYIANYDAVISYQLPNQGRKGFTLAPDNIKDALYHAVFDCYTIEDCKYILERWLLNAYEDWLYEELGDEIEGEYDLQVKVESRPKRK